MEIELNIDNTIMLPNGNLGTIVEQLDKKGNEIWFEVRDENGLLESYKESDLTPDLFEHYQTLPQVVQDVLAKYNEVDTYEGCVNMLLEMEKLGYTFEYYLDACPYMLRKITIKDFIEYQQK